MAEIERNEQRYENDALLSSLHELVDKNTKMQTELLKLRQEIPASDQSFPPCSNDENDGIPKDSMALCKRHLYLGEEASDAESTAAETTSDTSFGASWRSNLSIGDIRLKRVRFATAEDQDPLSLSSQQVLVESSSVPEPFSREERELIWYTPQDFRYFKKYSKKLASIAGTSSYGLELEEVWSICDNATTQDVTHCSRIANTAVRGLEAVVSEDMVASRRAAVRGVLEKQAKMRCSCEPGDQVEALCSTSRSLSRSARLLARILGNGDAAVARALAQ